MHILHVCSNPSCAKYRQDYVEASAWGRTQPMFKKILVAPCGGRFCNYCNLITDWNVRICPECKTKFGELKPDTDPEVDLKEKEVSIPMAELLPIASREYSQQCEVCELYNPAGAKTCMFCTAFMPVQSVMEEVP